MNSPMKIQDLFARDIRRDINGVVKADQLDESAVWQELDEFVVTQELNRHIHALIEVLVSTMDSSGGGAERNGIWVSGFFGSGKSHLIKVMSYLMSNETHRFGGEERAAIDFFDQKIEDRMLFGDMRRVVGVPTSTILFNVDSKADHRAGREALLAVFLRVLNEKLGYSGDHPHIADMERYLDDKGMLGDFHAAFERHAGEGWLAARDAWEFHRDAVVEALCESTGQSRESMEKLVDGGEGNFSLTVENFAKWVKQFLDRCGEGSRVMFLVDEVGQFIGSDTHLMLNLQTITEQLGTVCAGRAWVVVTSQEELDAVLGDLKGGKQHDFSKIQGRFKTRLSLSSANVDEVIKRRILEKKEAAHPALAAAYSGKEDILKNQLGFTGAGMTFKSYAGVEDFRDCYPFAAYQFQLVQKVFESIRKAGATGLHLSEGERSTLDAFQSAAKRACDRDVGALIPFYEFYPAVEGFLDSAVKRTIQQAGENSALQPFDELVLQVLFLIRYIDELPGSADNLATLFVDEIDADKLVLRRSLEESLARLESETLISRNGDLYFFLTNEERDISREIKNTPVPQGSEARVLSELIFLEALGDKSKHTYSETNKDFRFNRICDGHYQGNRLEGEIEVEVLTPLGDRYSEFRNDHVCASRTSENDYSLRVLFRLPDHERLARELRAWIQTDAYVRSKPQQALPDSTKRILKDQNDENRARKARLLAIVKGLLADASIYIHGIRQDEFSSDPKQALASSLDYLIKNAFKKMSLLSGMHGDNVKQELQSILRADDVDRLDFGPDDPNNKAREEVLSYVDLCHSANRRVELHSIVAERFSGMPYGWPELETAVLVAELAVMRKVDLLVDKKVLDLSDAYDHMVATNKQKKVVVRRREEVDAGVLKAAQELSLQLFGKGAGLDADAIHKGAVEHFEQWDKDLGEFLQLAQTGKYPGRNDIEQLRPRLAKLAKESDPTRFLKLFASQASELLEDGEDYRELRGFYRDQRRAWEQLLEAHERLKPNELELKADEDAAPKLKQLNELLANPRPYDLVPQGSGIVTALDAVNGRLVDEAREAARQRIAQAQTAVTAELEKHKVEDALATKLKAPLVALLSEVSGRTSIAHIQQAASRADGLRETAFGELECVLAEAANPGADGKAAPAAPKVKPRESVSMRDLAPSSGLIETSEELAAFVAAIKAKIQGVLDAGRRAQIK